MRILQKLAVAVVSLLAPVASAQDVLDNGQVNLSSQLPFPFGINEIHVQDSPAGDPTTLVIDSHSPSVEVFGSSVVDQTTGSISSTLAGNDTSSLTVRQQVVHGIGVTDDATALMLGGFTDFFVASGNGRATIELGSPGTLLAWDSGAIVFNGGYSGARNGVTARDAGRIDFFGGFATDIILAEDDGVINIRGGNFGIYPDGFCFSDAGICAFRTAGNGQINIFGSGFTVDGVAVPFGELSASSGVLAGTPTNGPLFTLPFSGNGTIRLLPSPAPDGIGNVSDDGAGNALWSLDDDRDGVEDEQVTFGTTADIPVVGDWNGDGVEDIGVVAVIAPGCTPTNEWRLDYGRDGSVDEVVLFGLGGQTPVVGDWDGDGDTDIGVVTDSGGDALWLLDFDRDGVADQNVSLGSFSTDLPVVGDWDGDGSDDIGFISQIPAGCFAINEWNLDTGRDGSVDETLTFGFWGASPVTGDWNGDGSDGIGFVLADGGWMLDIERDGVADESVSYGAPSIGSAVVGDW